MSGELLIGEIAELVGVSKDTIRIYEEQGLICPQRDENGFRRYGEEDIYRLISIKFYRESAFPLKELKQLMEGEGSRNKIGLLDRQICAERREELRHRRNRERLELAKTYFSGVQIPASRGTEGDWYQMSPSRDSYLDLMKEWFEASKRDPDLGACYLNMEYDLGSSMERPAAFYLLMKEQDAVCLRRQDLLEHGRRIPGGPCFRTVIPTKEPLPDRKDLEAVYACAVKEGARPTGVVHAHFQYMDEADGHPCFITELLLPLEKNFSN